MGVDLLELEGRDLRGLPLERRKAELKALLKRASFGLTLNDYAAGDGPALFAQACAMGLEGIVSKRRSSSYRPGRSPHWLKAKNPESPAARREAFEDWAGNAGGEGVCCAPEFATTSAQLPHSDSCTAASFGQI